MPEAALPALLLLAEAWQALAAFWLARQAGLRQVAARWAEIPAWILEPEGPPQLAAGRVAMEVLPLPRLMVASTARHKAERPVGRRAPAEVAAEPLALAGPREAATAEARLVVAAQVEAAWVAALLGAELSALAGPVVARLEVAGPWGMAAAEARPVVAALAETWWVAAGPPAAWPAVADLRRARYSSACNGQTHREIPSRPMAAASSRSAAITIGLVRTEIPMAPSSRCLVIDPLISSIGNSATMC